ncbi:MAG: 5-bromo-4-chloroindolyl phosphate hydrolysis family protein [Oscillospiraceae bacterium]|nr:5-bromo-4-chloroindolyl phosphate hydrolysis family protein [Oscillospiraceae bacterium]
MEKNRKKVKKSAMPVYVIAAIWLVSLLFPIGQLISFLIRGVVLSLIGFFIAKLIWRDREIVEPESQPEEEKKQPGNPGIDVLMEEGDRAISEMRRLNRNIENEAVSRQIDEMEKLTIKIFDHIIANPEKLPQIRKFLDYYLPTTLKILNAYDRMGSQGVSGENIDGTMGKIEQLMETVTVAFRRQLDALFGDEAMDIASDITVLENMMAREGLTGEPFQAGS